ncbi:hypothetical protein G5B38_01000 [Pseudohalocynthiibacter aestuariivivens]|nr:hypothetical protein [Pseudohalocynthiibacter aestuariivivens]QIE44219.1 hypothetical protein G5B38_01000 [Pseudohalocynthiibacter aestuariivivens]
MPSRVTHDAKCGTIWLDRVQVVERNYAVQDAGFFCTGRRVLGDWEPMKVVRIVFQIIVGMVFGIAAGLALSPLSAAISDGKGTVGFFVVFFVVTLLAAFAPTIRRAFGRGFLLLGAAIFALPVSTFILSGVVSHEMVSGAADADKGYAATGSVIAGGLMTSIAGLFGFVLGSISLIVGLVLSLGGRREVVIVERPQTQSAESTLRR